MGIRNDTMKLNEKKIADFKELSIVCIFPSKGNCYEATFFYQHLLISFPERMFLFCIFAIPEGVESPEAIKLS